MSIAPPPVHAAPEAPDAAAYRAPATDLLAMLAIGSSAAGATILPILGSLAGIVLGAIALVRIRRTRSGGLALAVGAIVVGVVGLVGMIALVVLFVGSIGSMAAQLAP